MQRVADLFKRFRRDERGVFAVFFALIAIVLIAAAGAVVDFTRVQQARTRAQIAIDSAALALQSQIGEPDRDADWFQEQAQALLSERMGDSSITAVIQSATPDEDEGKLTITGYISVPTYFVQLVGIRDIRASMLSQVTQSSNDLEVSVSLDVTGSMAPSGCDWWGNNCTKDKIGDLIDATNMLIDLLVKPADQQTPTYSKMAIVPWSYAVNVGSAYAEGVRGAPTTVPISKVTYLSTTSTNIVGITRASPGVITVSGTGTLQEDDWVYISGVSGMTQINGQYGRVRNLATSSGNHTFNLRVSGSNLCTTSGCGYSSATANTGMVTKCAVSNCLEVVTTTTNHGLVTNDRVVVENTVNTTGINGNLYQPTILTTTTYSLPGTSPSNGIGTGGNSQCVKHGCVYYRFTNASGGTNLYKINNCATDRTTNTYTDTAPSTTLLGKNYRSGGADCIDQEIVPLTSDRPTLHALANSLEAVGSTSGHLGLAWGWYMISPNFGYLWPVASRPKAYGSSNLIKAVIFMTDGDFNTPYCNGVVASDALSGSGGNNEHINCASPNGSSKSQAEALCTAIKAQSNQTLLYTIGFDLANNAAALTMLQNCATSPEHFYQADNGTDLQAAFQDIADTLSELRISR